MANLDGSRLRHGSARNSRKTREYVTWVRMRDRCNNPNHPAYHNYGGRGIKVCQRWDLFENFLADMGERPSDGTIDRIDTNGGYCPENCRWLDIRSQQRNRRNNRIITAFGVTATLVEHCERVGIKVPTAHNRLKLGASPEVALTPGRAKYGSLQRRQS